MALVRYDKPYMFDRQPSIIGSVFTRLNVWLMFFFRLFSRVGRSSYAPCQLPAQSAMHESRRGAT